MQEPTINDLYECRYEPDKLVILIERMHKNSLKSAVLAQQSTNTAMLQLLCDIKELFDKVGYIMMTKDSEMYRRTDAVLAQQQHG